MHLWSGTQAENQADKVEKGRQARADRHWTRNPEYALVLSSAQRQRRQQGRGVKNSRARFSEDDVRLIRTRVAKGETMAALAREFAVRPYAIQSIVSRKTWAHVD
jgi:hypothetical protein